MSAGGLDDSRAGSHLDDEVPRAVAFVGAVLQQLHLGEGCRMGELKESPVRAAAVGLPRCGRVAIEPRRLP